MDEEVAKHLRLMRNVSNENTKTILAELAKIKEETVLIPKMLEMIEANGQNLEELSKRVVALEP